MQTWLKVRPLLSGELDKIEASDNAKIYEG